MVTKEDVKKILTAPPMREKSFNISVKRYFTDVNGTVIAKGAAPANLQTRYPFYLFGEYDRQGGYFQALKNNAPENGTYFLCNFVFGIGNPFFYGFNPLSTIQSYIKTGDVVTVYTDSLIAPTFFVWIVCKSDMVSLASIYNNIRSSECDIIVKEILYYTDNKAQWKENLQALLVDKLGAAKADYLNPLIDRQPKTIQDDFIKIIWTIHLNQYKGMNSYIDFDTDSLNLVFKIKTV